MVFVTTQDLAVPLDPGSVRRGWRFVGVPGMFIDAQWERYGQRNGERQKNSRKLDPMTAISNQNMQ